MALATVMNCWGETALRTQRLRNVWSESDLRFDISTPFSRVSTFHPSLPFPLFVTEAANNSCMQLSLANCTYLLRESSLIDLFNKIMGRVLLSSIPNKIHNKIERTKLSNTKSPTRSLSKTNTSHEKSKCLISLVLVFTRIGCKVQDCCSLWLEWGYQLPAGVEFFKTIKHLVDWKVHKYMYTCVYICKRERGLCDDMSGS